MGIIGSTVKQPPTVVQWRNSCQSHQFDDNMKEPNNSNHGFENLVIDKEKISRGNNNSNNYPTAVQRSPMSEADVRSYSNQSHQFDDNTEEPINNNHDFKNLIINNEKLLKGNNDFRHGAPQSAADEYKSYVRSDSNLSHQFDENMKEPYNNNHVFETLITNNEKLLRGNNESNDGTPQSAADERKSCIRSHSNQSHQTDESMKEPNKNIHNFQNLIINNENLLRDNDNSTDDAPQFFMCYTSYSCTPTDITSIKTTQKIRESPQKPIPDDQGEQQVRADPNNNKLNQMKSSKPGPSVQFNNDKNVQLTTQPTASSCHPNSISQISQINELRATKCVNPAPPDQLINTKNTPRIPSPLTILNDTTTQKPSQPRNISGSIVSKRTQGLNGLAHSSSSPTISSKGSPSSSHNEILVLHYTQNPNTYLDLQERQLPSQGPVPKRTLPPTAPLVAKGKSNSLRNSNEIRRSLPNATMSGDGKSKDWEKVLTKFYQW